MRREWDYIPSRNPYLTPAIGDTWQTSNGTVIKVIGITPGGLMYDLTERNFPVRHRGPLDLAGLQRWIARLDPKLISEGEVCQD